MSKKETTAQKACIEIYDTTLRDGQQREGITFSVEDKVKIATKLSELGVHYIEGGFPGSNPKDDEFFKRAQKLDFGNSKIVAFGSVMRKGTSAASDEGLKALLDTNCEVVSLFGKVWDQLVLETLRISTEDNLQLIRDSISLLVSQGRHVFFLAEHAFDGFVSNPSYVIETCRAAVATGAERLVLCDTNGGSLPDQIARVVQSVKDALPEARVGIHAHNDSGCAIANSLLAVEAGAIQVQGTINGYGERVGNADLIPIIASLELKMGKEAIGHERLVKLTETSHFVAEIANISPDAYQPYVGSSAFTHKAGVHASGVSRLAGAYEHIDPTSVGNLARVVVSELAGRASLLTKARELGYDLSDSATAVNEIIGDIKRREHSGYSYEVADGSLELLIRSHIGQKSDHFVLESFRVIADKREDGRVMTEATIKVHVGDERFVATAEGNGPVNALDKALRLAITRFYPEIEEIELTDYKVRVLDETVGTDAITRVLITSSNGENSWSTMGVSENIIEASWEALVESIEYGLQNMFAQNTNSN